MLNATWYPEWEPRAEKGHKWEKWWSKIWCLARSNIPVLVYQFKHQFSRSVVSDSLQPPGPAACQASQSITNSWSLFKLMSTKSVMPANHLILCPPLLLPPSIFPSISVFSNESVLCLRWPKYWSFSFSISPSNEYLGPISFRLNWLDLLAVQGTLKRLLQHWTDTILEHGSNLDVHWQMNG